MSSVESSLVLSEKGICYDQCVLLTELLAFALLHFVPPGQTCQDTDLAYCDVEWFALETNRDHSVIFEVAPKYCISDFFLLTMRASPFLLMDSCLQ